MAVYIRHLGLHLTIILNQTIFMLLETFVKIGSTTEKVYSLKNTDAQKAWQKKSSVDNKNGTEFTIVALWYTNGHQKSSTFAESLILIVGNMLNVKKVSEERKSIGVVYDISLDGTVVNALGMNVMSNTDG